MSGLRIAMVGLRGLPATFGGIERHVEEIGSRLAERGHDVTVYCRPNYTPADVTSHRGVRLVHTPTLATKHLEAFVHSGLASLRVLGARMDVVHFHALGPGLFSPLPRYLSRARVVQTVHGLDDQRAKWGGAASKVLALGGWLSARVPDETITVSRTLADQYAARSGRVCAYIPNGAPEVSPRGPAEIRERFGLRGEDYVLWVGRIVPEKAPHQLIRAFREVPTDARLVIVGGSSFTDDYGARVKELADRDPRVLLTGFRYGPVLEELYSNAALYVQPSLLEGLPLTLLEAAAYRRPVVASDIGPHAEVVSGQGVGHRLVPVGDERALTGAIAEALAHPERARRGAALLHEQVRARYDWDQATEQTLDVYLRVLARRTVGHRRRTVRVPRQREPAPQPPPRSCSFC